MTADLIRCPKISPIEFANETLKRIERIDPKLNCFVTMTDEYALERAKQMEKEIMAGEFDESLIYRVAFAYEQATNWHLTHPVI